MSAEPRIIAGRYRVDEVIGEGGMAKVYRGYDLTLGRDVAIKILDPELARDTAFRTRFRLEAQAASRMSHPSIVRVFDAGDPNTAGERPTNPEDRSPYIVMELVHGTLLKDIIAAGPVSAEDAVRYVDGILEALDYSHKAGVVHRDIKPGNVMVTETGTVKVMDFGIARAVSDSSSTVAETTQIIGTAAYFSPEQAKGEPVDGRTDLYSTGVVLYELLTGRQPFRGDSPVAVAYQHVSETPLAPSEVEDDAPRYLDPIVLRALAKDPFQRFPDASTFRAALEGAASGRMPSKRQLGVLTSELYGPSPRQAQETARTLRQLSTDTTMARTQSGPPVAWIWAGVALLSVLLISVLFWVVTLNTPDIPSSSRTVPDLVDMNFENAQDKLFDLDLGYVIEQQPSSDFADGHVISTSPGAGAIVTRGDDVVLIVSTGVETVAVPALIGLSEQEAREALERAGLKLGAVRPTSDPDAEAGTVLDASADEAEEIAVGTAVDLITASGYVTLRNLSGFTVDTATEELDLVGLTAIPVELEDCTATDPHTVQSMSLAPGDVPVRSEVELRYCVGTADESEE